MLSCALQDKEVAYTWSIHDMLPPFSYCGPPHALSRPLQELLRSSGVIGDWGEMNCPRNCTQFPSLKLEGIVYYEFLPYHKFRFIEGFLQPAANCLRHFLGGHYCFLIFLFGGKGVIYLLSLLPGLQSMICQEDFDKEGDFGDPLIQHYLDWLQKRCQQSSSSLSSFSCLLFLQEPETRSSNLLGVPTLSTQYLW